MTTFRIHSMPAATRFLVAGFQFLVKAGGQSVNQ